jgi:hypothetical protein
MGATAWSQSECADWHGGLWHRRCGGARETGRDHGGGGQQQQQKPRGGEIVRQGGRRFPRDG